MLAGGDLAQAQPFAFEGHDTCLRAGVAHRAAEALVLGARVGQPSPHALRDHLALELGKQADDVEGQPPHGRGTPAGPRSALRGCTRDGRTSRPARSRSGAGTRRPSGRRIQSCAGGGAHRRWSGPHTHGEPRTLGARHSPVVPEAAAPGFARPWTHARRSPPGSCLAPPPHP